jgi:catechol 2,3-dioxygenase-like lactoylglutathione lyase family enzyme
MTIPRALPTTHPYRTDGWEREIYGMPAFPVILANDLARSSQWYQDVLGFADVFTMRGPDDRPLLVHLRWCKWADVLITQARTPVEPPRGQGITLNFMTLGVDELAERARAAGANVLDGPVDRPWNARDVTIADPDGYRLNFTGPSSNAARLSFDEVMKRARESRD